MMGRVLVLSNRPSLWALSRYMSLSIRKSSCINLLTSVKQFSRLCSGIPLNRRFFLLLRASRSIDLYSKSFSLSFWDLITFSTAVTRDLTFNIASSLFCMALTLLSFTDALDNKRVTFSSMLIPWISVSNISSNSWGSGWVGPLWPPVLILWRLDCFPRTGMKPSSGPLKVENILWVPPSWTMSSSGSASTVNILLSKRLYLGGASCLPPLPRPLLNLNPPPRPYISLFYSVNNPNFTKNVPSNFNMHTIR